MVEVRSDTVVEGYVGAEGGFVALLAWENAVMGLVCVGGEVD